MAARVRAAAWLEFPGHLAFLWPWVNHAPGPILRLPDGFWNAPVIAACLLQLGAVAGLFVLAARRSALAVPAALIVLPMLPLTLLALVRGELLFAERFVYVSSAGAAWLVAAAVGSGLRVGAPEGSAPSFAASGPLGWAVVVVAGVLTLGGGQRSAASLPMWRDDRAVFGTMVRERPENPVGQVGWARLLLDAGRLDESERNARAALELNPRTGLSYLVLGWIAIYRSEWDRALALADSARTLGTRVFEVALVRGTALARLGRYREAAVELEPLGRLMPDDAGIQAEWGRCLFYLGRNAEALAALDRAHANASISMNPEFHFVLGQALARAGERREARSALERAVDLEPAFEEGWLELARACDALGDGTGRDQALARAAALPDAHRDAIDSLRRGLAGPATGARRSGAGAP
jgi:predicted Zn-dependent protease